MARTIPTRLRLNPIERDEDCGFLSDAVENGCASWMTVTPLLVWPMPYTLVSRPN